MFDQALADFSLAAELYDDPTEKYAMLLARANALGALGRFEEARKQYEAIIAYRRAAGNPDALASAITNLGYHQVRAGEYGSALAIFREAETIAPKNTYTMQGIALVSRLLGDLDTALSYNSRLLELFPTGFGVLAELGETKRLKGDLDGAMRDLNKAIEIQDLPFIRLFRGRIFRYTGEADKALADFNAAIDKAPDLTQAYVERGLTYERRGELEKSRAEYRKALTTNSYNALGLAREGKEIATARLAALDKDTPLTDLPPAPAKALAKGEVTTKPLIEPKAPTKVISKERRVALVIGNSRYKSESTLANPSNDAGAVARALRSIGFTTVNLTTDATREALVNNLRSFAEVADNADWAVVYYAGHGIEIGGVNYLVPVDAKLSSDRDAQFEAVSLDQVLASVAGAKKLKLVVLDACRDNPFATKMRRTDLTRSMGRGLGRVEPEGATLVVYAAKHGQTALDGTGGNSPFAQALVNRLATPDVEINKIFRLVRDDVMEATAGRQEPFTYGSLPGKEDFFFVGK